MSSAQVAGSSRGALLVPGSWALDLSASAVAAGWAPGSYVRPSEDPTDAAPYGALLGPLLVGAAVELR